MEEKRKDTKIVIMKHKRQPIEATKNDYRLWGWGCTERKPFKWEEEYKPKITVCKGGQGNPTIVKSDDTRQIKTIFREATYNRHTRSHITVLHCWVISSPNYKEINIIKYLKTNKTTGIDNITVKLVKFRTQAIIAVLNVLNQIDLQ